MDYISWILFAAVFLVSYWIGFKTKSYWSLFLSPVFGFLTAGINMWIYFASGHAEKIGLGVLVVVPVFVVMIGSLGIASSLAGLSVGVYRGRKKTKLPSA